MSLAHSRKITQDNWTKLKRMRQGVKGDATGEEEHSGCYLETLITEELRSEEGIGESKCKTVAGM